MLAAKKMWFIKKDVKDTAVVDDALDIFATLKVDQLLYVWLKSTTIKVLSEMKLCCRVMYKKCNDLSALKLQQH